MIDMDNKKNINEYIEFNKKKINNKYRLKYHMMPSVGWMNDPNGLVKFNDTFHLFYQFNPYNTQPGTMLWGHCTSGDLIKYNDEPIGIVPDKEHTSIFSGGAIIVDNEINAVYTEHYEYEGIKTEEVYLTKINSYSENKIRIFDNNKLPKNICKSDFRDPFPIFVDGEYYVFIGGKDIELNKGIIVVLKGKSLEELDYHFTIGPLYALGDMGECPSYYKINNKDVLVASGCRVGNIDNDYKNTNSSVFIVGDIDFKEGKMSIDFVKEIDKGDTFYAPQFINGFEEPVIIGWLEMWDKKYPTHDLGHGWTGAFSMPRKIILKDQDIFQEPIEQLKQYQKEYVDEYSKCLDISLVMLSDGEFEIKSDNGSVKIYNNGYINLDTRNANNFNGCVRRTNNKYYRCKVRILLDVSSIELFIDNGKEVISSRIYLDGKYIINYNSNVIEMNIKELEVK